MPRIVLNDGLAVVEATETRKTAKVTSIASEARDISADIISVTPNQSGTVARIRTWGQPYPSKDLVERDASLTIEGVMDEGKEGSASDFFAELAESVNGRFTLVLQPNRTVLVQSGAAVPAPSATNPQRVYNLILSDYSPYQGGQTEVARFTATAEVDGQVYRFTS